MFLCKDWIQTGYFWLCISSGEHLGSTSLVTCIAWAYKKFFLNPVFTLRLLETRGFFTCFFFLLSDGRMLSILSCVCPGPLCVWGPRLIPTAALAVGAEMLGTAMKACTAWGDLNSHPLQASCSWGKTQSIWQETHLLRLPTHSTHLHRSTLEW